MIKPPTVYDEGKFYVSWPASQQYPWTKYAVELFQENFDDNEDLASSYRRFKRIATTLRSHGRGTLARTRRKVEHQRVLQGILGQALLDQLKKDGILTLGDGGARYFWDPKRAADLLEVSWQDLRKWTIPSRLQKYLLDFIRENPGLFKQ